MIVIVGAGPGGLEAARIAGEKGHEVVGIDNMNDYYDVRLKEYRLSLLEKIDGFNFIKGDIENVN